MPTVIVPIHTTRTRDCIVVQGKKYCESQNMTKGEAGALCGSLLLWFALIAGAFVWAERRDKCEMWPVMAALFLPVILAPIAGLIWAIS